VVLCQQLTSGVTLNCRFEYDAFKQRLKVADKFSLRTNLAPGWKLTETKAAMVASKRGHGRAARNQSFGI
jgi:hypothetical protein